MRTNVTPEEPLTEEIFEADAEVQKLKDRCISCKTVAINSIFVNAKGIAGPCCFIHASLDMTPMSTVDFQLRRRNESLGLDAFNLRATSLDKIIENLNTIYALPQSIGLDGKVMYCATICSVSSKIDVLYRDNERL